VIYIIVKVKLNLELNVCRFWADYLYLTSYIIKLRYRHNIEAIEKTKGF